MTGLIVAGLWVLGVLVYLGTGAMLARVVFVKVLGDHKRRCGEYHLYWTEPFIRAVWSAVGTLLFWPALTPVLTFMLWVFSSTPAERYEERMARLKKDEREVARLVDKYGLADLKDRS